MLMTEPTPEMITQWEQTFAQYGPKLQPNKKSAQEVVSYLQAKYPMQEILEDNMAEVIIQNVVQNAFFAAKIPQGQTPRAQVFLLLQTEQGAALYDAQDEEFQGISIIVGVEHQTAFCFVEGSSALYDEIKAFQGLDATDLTNPFCVWEYVDCLKRFGLLEEGI